jgi:hypothetical protein
MRTNKARFASRLESEISTNTIPAFEGRQAAGAEGGAIGQLVGRAISLRPRGGAGKDGLVVQSLSARLRVELLARPVHPWDRDLPADERSELFVQQCLEDVSTAIPKLFQSMPEVEELEVTVLDPKSKSAIIAGIVKRNDAMTSNHFSSAGMKLRAMGLAYGRSNSGFERMVENPVLVWNARERTSDNSASPK